MHGAGLSTKGTSPRQWASVALALALSVSIPLLPEISNLPRPGAQIDHSWYRINNTTLVTTQSDQLVDAARRLNSTFVLSHPAEETVAFLDSSRLDAVSFTGRWSNRIKYALNCGLHQLLGWPRTDARAVLHMSSTFLASHKQWKQLTAGAGDAPRSLLDVGAGPGDVTTTLAQALRVVPANVTGLESSWALRYALRSRGFGTIGHTDELGGDQFDVIALLNVLDRCDKPVELIASAVRRLRPSGLLIVAAVFPFCQLVFQGKVGKVGHHVRPRIPLPILPSANCSTTFPFELSAAAFVVVSIM